MIARILQRLAQRKSDVYAIYFNGLRGIKPGAHHSDRFRRKAVGLEVGKAPPRIAKVRAVCRRGKVGVDGLRGLPDSFERMAEPQVDIGPAQPRIGIVARNFGQHFAIDRDDPVKIAQPDRNGSSLRAVGVVARIERQQRSQRLGRLREFVPRDQHLNIFAARLVVVGHHRQHPGVEQFGIIQHIADKPYLRQQAHCFGMIAEIEQEAPDQHFGTVDLAIAVERLGVDNRRWQAGQMGAVARGQFGILGVAGHPRQAVEHAPGDGQRRVQRYRHPQVGNRCRRIAQRNVAQPAFEEHLAVARMLRGERFE